MAPDLTCNVGSADLNVPAVTTKQAQKMPKLTSNQAPCQRAKRAGCKV